MAALTDRPLLLFRGRAPTVPGAPLPPRLGRAVRPVRRSPRSASVHPGPACAIANERDGYGMRQALGEILRGAVDEVRRAAGRLSARVEQIDRTHSAQ